MKRKELINAITDFCLEYKLFDRSVKVDVLINKISEQLKDIEFVESLINTIIIKTRKRRNIDTNKIKNLLLELEKIRLELEYKDIK